MININFLNSDQSPNMLPALPTASSFDSLLTLDSSYSKLQTPRSLLPLAFFLAFLCQRSLLVFC